jgi:hypothetical protein
LITQRKAQEITRDDVFDSDSTRGAESYTGKQNFPTQGESFSATVKPIFKKFLHPPGAHA